MSDALPELRKDGNPSVETPLEEKDEILANSPSGSSLSAPAEFKPTRAFWLVFAGLCTSSFLTALDMTCIASALPSMAEDLKSNQYAWVGSAYALTSTALIPWVGGLARIFGRRWMLLYSLAFFAAGSAISGAAKSMNLLIVGRAISGAGGGGILAMTQIVIVDLVPLSKRGLYLGIIGLVYAFASGTGPIVGGALARNSLWRWLFYMNLPISAVAAVLVTLFLNVKVPQTTFKEKMKQLDPATPLFVAAATATILGLDFGGGMYEWASYQVIVPLVLGVVGMGIFFWIEKRFIKYPVVPFEVVAHRTALLGFITCFLHGMCFMSVAFYFPSYFQACKGDSPLLSGVKLFALSFTIAPCAILTGAFVTITGHYRWVNTFGWAVTVLGFGLISLLTPASSQAETVCFPMILGIGLGILFSALQFPVVAPIAPEQQPFASAFFSFVRTFGNVLGITIASTALTNSLAKNLPARFLAAVGGSADEAFAAIPLIHTIPEPMQTLVKDAFATSLSTVYRVMIGLAGLGLVLSLFLQQIELSNQTDQAWALEDADATAGAGADTSSSDSTKARDVEEDKEAQAISPAETVTPLASAPAARPRPPQAPKRKESLPTAVYLAA